jgi:hypothetical protein
LHSAKHFIHKTSTDAGITISINPFHKITRLQFVIISTLIQISLR